jgi:predicted nuclease of restriction endonuclease-like (RecB) superfamily
MKGSEIVIYQSEEGSTKIDVRMEDETVWLSLDQMADLFQRDKSTISRHIKNIFEEAEVRQESVVANFATTATDGKTYQVDYYNLDIIRNLKYIHAFAEAWPNISIMQEALAQLPWYHHLALLDKLKSSTERLVYAQAALKHGWSREIETFMEAENAIA